ncbi:uncharacterized protein LOC124406243 [Diprion similis]|uniref:uncharacterized protein LOC124406243 n=1 Tax=Diprion similis TaxID=362088 RepID=UPI001EF91419|nr:uncharacterized protein LOC124406243 [Diprion similis]
MANRFDEFHTVIDKLDIAYQRLTTDSNEDLASQWNTISLKLLKTLNDFYRDRTTSFADIRKIQTLIVKLTSQRAVSNPSIRGGSHDAPAIQWNDLESAFEKLLITGVITNVRIGDLKLFLTAAYTVIFEKLNTLLRQHHHLKVNTTLSATFVLDVKSETKFFHTKNATLQTTSNLAEWYEEYVASPLLAQIEEFQERDSGWALISIHDLLVNIEKYEPLVGSMWINLPSDIKVKKAVVNVQNADNACFAWACVSARHPAASHVNRVTYYPHYNQVFNFTERGKRHQVVPLLISRYENPNIEHNNLLMLHDENFDDESSHERTHFCWIKNLSRRVNRQLNAPKLLAHRLGCSPDTPCKLTLPDQFNKWLQFVNYSNKMQVPYIVYADFECLLEKSSQSSESSHTKIYQKHVPYSAEFENAEVCHICELKFVHLNDRVTDHCHVRGLYRGPAHSNCNLNYKLNRTVPVVFHNLSGYDAHFIIDELANIKSSSLSVLPITKEKYIAFTQTFHSLAVRLQFIDSYRRMSSSLAELSSYLRHNDLTNLKCQLPNATDSQFNLLTRKGIFPYDYVTEADRLNERSLPSKESFYNVLNDQNIEDEDYAHAQNVWHSFNSDLYLKIDVMLLPDVFQNFRDNCLRIYKLDPAHYCTLPGFTWDCMLFNTKIQLELLTDVDMLLFIGGGLRGGLSQCSNRYSKANNKCMTDYNPQLETKSLLYLDVNNLYGWAMSQYLHCRNFEWVHRVHDFDFMHVGEESDDGYILEVDFEYPTNVYVLHQDLPFCPNHQKPPGGKTPKLLATLQNKTRYVIHHRNLQQCVTNGLILRKIHRILKFKQSAWLKSYIDLNTALRAKSANKFEQNLYKLMNNAVFGKTMENVRKYSDVKLAQKWHGRCGAKALISRPNFHSRSIFDENFVVIQLNRLGVIFNKPIYAGMAILVLSKICVYDFHYFFMLPKLKSNCKLMYTDTDSLIYEIKSCDVYEFIRNNIDRFDTSDYPADNIYKIPQVNIKVVGLIKDERNGEIMTEFV